MKKPLVAIIMGSDSDLPVMNAASETLTEFEIPHDVLIVSAHRTPEWMYQFAQTAHKKGYKIIIAGAGGAAHLPGMVASLTPLPVIGVPVQVGKLSGIDALLSIAQMPKGVPVATVAVDNSHNAGLLAVRMLGIAKNGLVKAMLKFQKSQTNKILEANKHLQNLRLKQTKPKKPTL
jgi:phosphoribosylaminoimidazole carboxylase PurE protein